MQGRSSSPWSSRPSFQQHRGKSTVPPKGITLLGGLPQKLLKIKGMKSLHLREMHEPANRSPQARTYLANSITGRLRTLRRLAQSSVQRICWLAAESNVPACSISVLLRNCVGSARTGGRIFRTPAVDLRYAGAVGNAQELLKHRRPPPPSCRAWRHARYSGPTAISMLIDTAASACYKRNIASFCRGPVAQLGARMTGSHEVEGSNPSRSTISASVVCCYGA